MPQNATLDLLAEDITQPTWDELTSIMLDGEPEDQPDTLSCGPGSSTGCSGDFTWDPE
jgi:hypothetical protein